MPATRACLLSLMTWLMCACITYPVVEPRQDLSCQLVTRELTLKTKDMMVSRKDCIINAFNCLVEAAIGSTTFVASSVVSGSVVLVGNTLHWLERSQRCPPAAPSLAASQASA